MTASLTDAPMPCSPCATTIVEELEGLLGSPLTLIAWPIGVKGTAMKWQELGPEALRNPAYRGRLAEGNIGVAVGTKSGGLCSIDIDDDARLDEFLALNPKLASALRTRGERGGNVWVRITGPYPPLTKIRHRFECDSMGDPLDIGEWRSSGGQTIVHGVHPTTRQPYTRVVDAPPAHTTYQGIVWPEDWIAPQAKPAPQEDPNEEITRKYGAPFAPTKDGSIGPLNERFWGGLYHAEHNIVHDPTAREFYQFDPSTGLWRETSADFIRETIAARIVAVAEESGRVELKHRATTLKLGHAVSALRGIAEARGFFDNRERIIHVANGVLELRDDGGIEFTTPRPDHRSRNRSPINWDPTAVCPQFLRFVDSALDPEDIDLLQRWWGVALCGRNLPQRIVLADGAADTGKSTTARIIQAIVGAENTYQLRTEHLAERFELFRYRTKTLLLGPDVPGDFLGHRGAAILKALVGGDPLSAEGKGTNSDFPLHGDFNVFITANSRLRVRLEGDVSAWRRRLTILRYEKPPPAKRILGLADQLVAAEGPGILRWALSGFVAALQEFRELGDFRLSPAQVGRVDALLMESDSLRAFLAERVERHPDADLTVFELVEQYADFCATRGWNVLPDRVLHRQLPDLMLELFQTPQAHSLKRDGRSLRGYRSVQLKEVSDGA